MSILKSRSRLIGSSLKIVFGPRSSQHCSQQGSALVTVLSLIVLLTLLGGVSAGIISRSQSDTAETFRKEAQATNIARAGLQDAIGWFKRKSALSGSISNSPPYSGNTDCANSAFAPIYHADPTLRETEDANVGLVKDLRLDTGRNIYGRYIIRKQGCKNGVSAAEQSNNDYMPGQTGYNKLAVHDVTEQRGKGTHGLGLVWELGSEGIVYIRNDFSKNADGVFLKGPDEAPNRILDRAFAKMEINRMSLQKPVAPITVTEPSNGDSSQSRFDSSCKVVGRDAEATIIYTSNGGQNPNGNAECQYEDCSGTKDDKRNRYTSGDQDPMSVEELFAVSQPELKSMADYVYINRDELEAAHFQESLDRSKLPMALYYLDGNFTFTNSHALQGSGIIFVNGNLQLDPDSFLFTGVLYVTGKLTVKNNNEIAGAAFGNEIDCRPGLKSNFEYSEGVIENVRDTLALYRENTLTFSTRN